MVSLLAVLNGLPPKYDHLIVALDTMGDETKLTLEFTKSRLMQEEQRSDERDLRNQSKVKTEDVALVGNPARKMWATCLIVAIICVFGATNLVMLPDIAGQRCILITEIADIAIRRLAILLKL
jgi:hypothetical protein